MPHHKVGLFYGAVLKIFIFFIPFYLFAETKFEHESELAILRTQGNTEVETYNYQTKSKYEFGKRTLKNKGHYTVGFAREELDDGSLGEKTENARNWEVGMTYLQKLSKKIEAIVATNYEGNEFLGIKQRENYDIGLHFNFIENDKAEMNLDVTSRYTEEHRLDESLYFNKANLNFVRIDHFNEILTTEVEIQYLPNFTRDEDYQINAQTALIVNLDKTFSLKLAYKAQYDNEPNQENNVRLDTTYTTSLLARF